MRLLAALTLAAALGLSACGAAQEAGSGSTAQEPSQQPAAAVPDSLYVVCTVDGARVDTPTVAPQADGLHLEVVNELDAERAVSVSGETSGLGFGVQTGTTEEVVDIGPGEVTVGCDDPAVEPQPGTPVEVVDPDGLWVPTELPCPEQFSQVTDYIQGAKGETSDPLEAARKTVEGYGLEPDDVFEPAGYPEAEAPAVRLVRGGAPIAVVHLFGDGGGKWLAGTVTGCSSLEG